MSESEKPYSVTFSGYIFEPEDKSPAKPTDWNTFWYDATATMLFTPPMFGSCDFLLIGTPRGSLTRVLMSCYYDPIERLISWLEDISAATLPAVIKIDQEGSFAVFQALSVTDRPDWIELVIDYEPYPENKEYEHRMFWARVVRKQLVREFLRRYKDWLANDYSEKEWHLFGKHDVEEDENPEACTNPYSISLMKLEEFSGRKDDKV